MSNKVTIQFLTKVDFIETGEWSSEYDCPVGWSAQMNKFLGQTITIDESTIDSVGCFYLEGWYFRKSNYRVLTKWEESSTESKEDKRFHFKVLEEKNYIPQDLWKLICVRVQNNVESAVTLAEVVRGGFSWETSPERLEFWVEIVDYLESRKYSLLEDYFNQFFKRTTVPLPRFKVGDRVTYKSYLQCGGKYYYDGEDQKGFVGEISSYDYYVKEKGCYKIYVRTSTGSTYMMLESEFYEYDNVPLPEVSIQPMYQVGQIVVVNEGIYKDKACKVITYGPFGTGTDSYVLETKEKNRITYYSSALRIASLKELAEFLRDTSTKIYSVGDIVMAEYIGYTKPAQIITADTKIGLYSVSFGNSINHILHHDQLSPAPENVVKDFVEALTRKEVRAKLCDEELSRLKPTSIEPKKVLNTPNYFQEPVLLKKQTKRNPIKVLLTY